LGYYLDHTINNHVSQLVVRQMSIRGVLSLMMYHVGDYICDVIDHNNIDQAWMHRLYQQMMCTSSRLDTQNEVWEIIE